MVNGAKRNNKEFLIILNLELSEGDLPTPVRRQGVAGKSLLYRV